MLIHKDNKTYRVRNDGNWDKRFKASRGLDEPKRTGVDVKRNPIKSEVKTKKNHRTAYLALMVFLFSMYTSYDITNNVVNFTSAKVQAFRQAHAKEMISPVIYSCLGECDQFVEEHKMIEEEAYNFKSFKGIASWYGESADECLGCSDHRIMANGERFNENEMTLAMNNVALNSHVLVINTSNGKEEVAKVTDTGGFTELGRVADLSKGLKNKLECTDLCEVEILLSE